MRKNNNILLEDMALFPEDSPQVINLTLADLDDDPLEVNDGAIQRLDNVDDEAFEFGTVLEDSVPDNAPVEKKQEAQCAERGFLGEIMRLITDEQEAITGYNNFLSTLSIEAIIPTEDAEKIKKVIADIIKEENTHIGQLMEIQKLFNPYGEEIEKGVEEGQEQLSEKSEKAAAKSLFEEISKATFIDPKFAKPESNNESSTASEEEVCTLADTDDEF